MDASGASGPSPSEGTGSGSNTPPGWPAQDWQRDQARAAPPPGPGFAPPTRADLHGGDLRLTLSLDGKDLVVGPGQTVRIGRSPDNDLVTNAPTVSRQHAVLSWGAEGWEFGNTGTAATYHNGRPVTRMVWSEAYAGVQFRRDPDESALTYGDRAKVTAFLAGASHGTLVAWDADIGPSWYGLTGDQIERLGYIALQRQATAEAGLLPSWVASVPGVGRLRALMKLDPDAPRKQEFWLLYRE